MSERVRVRVRVSECVREYLCFKCMSVRINTGRERDRRSDRARERERERESARARARERARESERV